MQKIFKIYGYCFSALTVLLGFVFLLGAASIYFTGTDKKAAARAAVLEQAAAEGWSEEQTQIAAAAAAEEIPIYSREIVGKTLRRLLPFAAIWAVGLAGAIVLSVRVVAPRTAPRRDPDRMLSDKLREERKRLPRSAAPGKEEPFAQAVAAANRCRAVSVRITAAMAAVAAVCLLIPFLYFANRSHFPNENLNREVIHAVLFALPFLVLLLGGAIAFVTVQNQLMKREREAIRAARLSGDRATAERVSATTESLHSRLPLVPVLRCVLLAVGIALVVLGVLNGSAHEVLVKATKICTECIGLG